MPAPCADACRGAQRPVPELQLQGLGTGPVAFMCCWCGCVREAAGAWMLTAQQAAQLTCAVCSHETLCCCTGEAHLCLEAKPAQRQHHRNAQQQHTVGCCTRCALVMRLVVKQLRWCCEHRDDCAVCTHAASALLSCSSSALSNRLAVSASNMTPCARPGWVPRVCCALCWASTRVPHTTPRASRGAYFAALSCARSESLRVLMPTMLAFLCSVSCAGNKPMPAHSCQHTPPADQQ